MTVMAPSAGTFTNLESTVTYLEQLLDAVADTMPRSCITTDLAIAADPTRFRELTTLIARLHHVSELLAMMCAGAVDTAAFHRNDHLPTSRAWVTHHHGLTKRDANELVRADQTRRRHPLVDRAVRNGELTLAQVLAIGTIIPDRLTGQDRRAAIELVDEVMQTLLDQAAPLSIDQFRQLCAAARNRLDTDGPQPVRKDDPNSPSEVRLTPLFNGRWALTGDLSAADGALISTMFQDAQAQELRANRANNNANSSGGGERGHGERGDGERGDGERGYGERGGNSSSDRSGDGDDTGDPPKRPLAQWQGDIMIRILANGSATNKPGRAAFYLHINLDDLLNRHDLPHQLLNGTTPTAWTEAGYDIDDTTIWNWLAGADLTPIYEHGGQPLAYGRTRRIAPNILRRAIAYRDRHCQANGCDTPPIWTEAHHLQHWEDGGTTDPDNMFCKCAPQHRAEHQANTETIGQPRQPPCFRQRVIDRRNEQNALVTARLDQLLNNHAASKLAA